SPFLPSLPPHLSPLRQTCIRRRRLIQSYRRVDTPVQGRSSRRPFPQGGLLKVYVASQNALLARTDQSTKACPSNRADLLLSPPPKGSLLHEGHAAFWGGIWGLW
ncbi:hypothetical protein BKA70DRAFT_1561445, partial [Coprinopsis sp. MPI-PUGE-AT-0042]